MRCLYSVMQGVAFPTMKEKNKIDYKSYCMVLTLFYEYI